MLHFLLLYWSIQCKLIFLCYRESRFKAIDVDSHQTCTVSPSLDALSVLTPRDIIRIANVPIVQKMVSGKIKGAGMGSLSKRSLVDVISEPNDAWSEHFSIALTIFW